MASLRKEKMAAIELNTNVTLRPQSKVARVEQYQKYQSTPRMPR